MKQKPKEPKTLQAAIVYFSDPDRALAYMVTRRWRDGVILCPTCGADGVRYIATRRMFECKNSHPRKQFSIKVGTIMEDSAIPLDKWLTVMWMVANCKNGVSSHEIHRTVGVTQKSAWFMVHRIRLSMKEDSTAKLGTDGGPVQMDETFIGGQPKNMHRGRRLRINQARSEQFVRSTVKPNKTAVFGMLDKNARTVRATVVADVKREDLQDAILANLAPGATMHTDEAAQYLWIAKDHPEYVHEIVNHAQEYVRGHVTTNGIENFWALLKRTLRGTYVAVEPFHLEAYVDEQVFRFNNRATKDNPLTDSDRFDLAVSQIANKRLTYAELTGKTSSEATF
jgi:transposase-like protein